jgi:hypothetical protein
MSQLPPSIRSSLILPDDDDENDDHDEGRPRPGSQQDQHQHGHHPAEEELFQPSRDIMITAVQRRATDSDAESTRSHGTYERKENPESGSSWLERIPKKDPPFLQPMSMHYPPPRNTMGQLEESGVPTSFMAARSSDIPGNYRYSHNINGDNAIKSTNSTMSEDINSETDLGENNNYNSNNALLISTGASYRNDYSYSDHTSLFSFANPSTLSTSTKSVSPQRREEAVYLPSDISSQGGGSIFDDAESGVLSSSSSVNKVTTAGAPASSLPGTIQHAFGHPTSILNERYQKDKFSNGKKIVFTRFADTTNGDHMPWWSAIFVCPKTGEVFPSGQLLTSLQNHRNHRDINWYLKLNQAERAAAGRAEDCFRFREQQHEKEKGGSFLLGRRGTLHQFCHEPPHMYVPSRTMDDFPQCIPMDVIDEVRRLQASALNPPK